MLDEQRDGGGHGDPWMELLLGLISAARRLDEVVAVASAPIAEAATERSGAGGSRDDEENLDALLGLLALRRRFDADLEPWWRPSRKGPDASTTARRHGMLR